TVSNVNGDRTWSMNKDGSEPAAFPSFDGYDFLEIQVQPLTASSDQKEMKKRGKRAARERRRGPGSGLDPETGRAQLVGNDSNIAIWEEGVGLYRLLPGFPTDNYGAVWSPDGTKIAFI